MPYLAPLILDTPSQRALTWMLEQYTLLLSLGRYS
jgi:hypothetical protein